MAKQDHSKGTPWLPIARYSDKGQSKLVSAGSLLDELGLAMRKRKSFNPKRRLCTDAQLAGRQHLIEELANQARYGGNPEHKRNPGDFGLDPPSSPRPGKTLCDVVQIHTRAAALALLRTGLTNGVFSVRERGGWPQNVWAVTGEGEPLEAQLEGDGVYHGYPMPQDDPFRDVVLARWNQL
jgi:hypothetical protein